MLEVRRIVSARREQNDGGGAAFRGKRTKRGEERLAVLLNGPHTAFAKQRRENLLHHLAAGQHVGDAAGHAQIVLQNHKPAIRQTNQVSSRQRSHKRRAEL